MHRSSKKRKLTINETRASQPQPQPPRKRRKVCAEMKTQLRRNNNNRKKKNFKKMKIKAFAVSPKLSVSYERETVDKLMAAVSDIHGHRVCRYSFEELYRSCCSLCSLKKGKLMYDKLYILCDKHVATQIARLDGLSDCSLLHELRAIWDAHRSEMTAIRQVFLMLDRSYVRCGTEMKSLWKMGIHLLSKHVRHCPSIVEYMIHNVLLLIEKERSGEEIEISLIKRMIEMMAHLNMYKHVFEKQLIASSNEYYAAYGAKLIRSLIVGDYLSIVMKCLDDEHLRCVRYLDNKTQRYLSVAIEEQMIRKHVHTILDARGGLNDMMDAHAMMDLRHLYKLLLNVNALVPLQSKFAEYCKQRGADIVKDEAHDADMIGKLLKLKAALDAIIQHAFSANLEFRNIIRKSWEYFLNSRQNKPAELMAKFIDYQLQTGARGTSESELEDALDGVMDIFRFVHGKDVFCAFYKKDLAKRLLLNTSSSFDAEKNMINRIRKECGQSIAANLENMFGDIDISKDLNDKFTVSNATTNIEFNFNVLTSGCWPTYNTQSIALPPQIEDELSRYDKFYISINSGRKLKWTSHLSHCIMAANFPRGRKELVLSAFQATVLLLFNDCNKLKLDWIATHTKIAHAELAKTMLSLVKAHILLKKSKGAHINEAEEFKLNAKYENRLRRVKVNQIQIIETKEEVVKTSHKIKKDRQYQIDACIVRVMKARKELVHQQLMAQCLKQLKFDAAPKQIKKRIAALIENEYLQRDKKNMNLYHYKA